MYFSIALLLLKDDELPLHCPSKRAKHLHFTGGETDKEWVWKKKGQKLSLFSNLEKILLSETKLISSQFWPATENTWKESSRGKQVQ